MTGDTAELAWNLPFVVQVVLPVLAIIGTWMAGKIKAKSESIKREQEHALALAAQREDFDGRKRVAGMARDKQLFDMQQEVIEQLRKSNVDGAHREARMDEKFNELYGDLGDERAHSLAWDEWYANGMPNPPGKPVRPPRRTRHRAPQPDETT